jgi:hypothetical protein
MARKRQSAGQKKDSPAVLRLNKKLYSEEAVKRAVADFRRVCRCSLADRGRFYTLRLSSKSSKAGSADILMHELANYALALMKNSLAEGQ